MFSSIKEKNQSLGASSSMYPPSLSLRVAWELPLASAQCEWLRRLPSAKLATEAMAEQFSTPPVARSKCLLVGATFCRMLPKRRKTGPYTKGEINRLIDSFLHPHMRGERKASVVILDAVAHALVEQDPGKSFRSFVKYGLPKLLEEGDKKENRGRSRKRSRG